MKLHKRIIETKSNRTHRLISPPLNARNFHSLPLLTNEIRDRNWRSLRVDVPREKCACFRCTIDICTDICYGRKKMYPDVSNACNHAQTLIINLHSVYTRAHVFFSIAYNFICCRRINANVYNLLFNSLFDSSSGITIAGKTIIWFVASPGGGRCFLKFYTLSPRCSIFTVLSHPPPPPSTPLPRKLLFHSAARKQVISGNSSHRFIRRAGQNKYELASRVCRVQHRGSRINKSRRQTL